MCTYFVLTIDPAAAPASFPSQISGAGRGINRTVPAWMTTCHSSKVSSNNNSNDNSSSGQYTFPPPPPSLVSVSSHVYAPSVWEPKPSSREYASNGNGSGNRSRGHGGVKLFVGGLPFEDCLQELRAKFGEFGCVTDAFCPKNKETQEYRGFGFVTFEDEACANAAISAASSGAIQISGRTIKANIAKPPGSASAFESINSKTDQSDSYNPDEGGSSSTPTAPSAPASSGGGGGWGKSASSSSGGGGSSSTPTSTSGPGWGQRK